MFNYWNVTSSIEVLFNEIENNNDFHICSTDEIWKHLLTVNPSNYDLYLTTDGEIYDECYDSYVSLYNNLNHKPNEIFMFYIGCLNSMNMRFLDCFPNVTYTINGIDINEEIVTYTSTKVGKENLLKQLCELDEFKRIEENTVDSPLEPLLELYKVLYRKIVEYSEHERNGLVGVEFKKFVDIVNGIVREKYIDVQIKNDAERFDDLFADYKSNSKEIFDIFVKRFLAVTTVDYRKVLSQIVELGNGQTKVDRRLMAYGGNWYQRVRYEMVPTGENSDNDESDVDEDDEQNECSVNDSKASESSTSCPILLLDSSEYSKFCVLWIGIDGTFGGNKCETMLDMESRRKLAKNTLRLFEFLPADQLNRRIAPANQHISIDAFVGLEAIQPDEIGNKWFPRIYKSPLHQVSCFGLILYNIDSRAHLPATTMTQNEMNIFTHNSATITQLLFGDSKFVGSFPLLYTFFLQILKQCPQLDQYMRACIDETIKRSATILKCPFMLQSGLEPNFKSTVRNAIIFHTGIYPNEIDRMTEPVGGIQALNIPRKCIQYSSNLLALARDIFGVTYSAEYQNSLKLWQFWNYMLCVTNMTYDQKLLHFKQIALSKIQNWRPIDCDYVKIMFVPGHSEKAYFDYLDGIEYEEIVKLIVLFEKTSVRRLTSNISTKRIQLEATGQWYNIRTVEKMQEMSCNVTKLEFCKPRCGFPIICPWTNMRALECYENQRFNLCDYGYPENSSTLYAHSYVQKSRTFILSQTCDEKTMQIPSSDQLKKYIVRKTPLAVYHANVDDILEGILSKYRIWYAWFENANEHEKSKYLWIHQDWKKILSSKANHNDRLAKCDCEAHRIV